jgi:hypothetical protein
MWRTGRTDNATTMTTREQVRAEATRLGLRAQVLPGHAESLELDDHSVDAVVCSFVLCSVADQAAALAQVRRLLHRFDLSGPFGLGIPHLAGAAEPHPEGPTR